MRFSERSAYCKHYLGKQLFQLMEVKQTNLGVVIDVGSSKELLKLADTLGPSICILKTHVDILEDFSLDVMLQLRELSNKHNFLIFEDRKFADIGAVALQQYRGGMYKISSWAHITNAHSLPGPGLIEGLRQEGMPQGNGLLLLAEMSSKGNLLDASYTEKTIELAKQYDDFVMGFISQKKLVNDPGFIYMVPGVKLKEDSDSLGQQYRTVENAITHDRCDIALVGRGIMQAPNREDAAKIYRQAAWEAYLNRL